MTDWSDIPVAMNGGDTLTLDQWRGKVVLVVNVASKCGLTPQYEGLEALYRDKHDAGLEILGVPSNDFLGQEPGNDAEIAEFCQLTYDVTFPLASKTPVSGPDRHPLYSALIAAIPDTPGAEARRAKLSAKGIPVNQPPEVQWNFEKFLIGRDGTLVARFAPDTKPDDPAFLQAIDDALGQAADR
ncbi:MAG: glutathione peroxidase [Paracoccus denitrificans]|nr:MAG: glutathione peroxidase [Paracoccus denitrificans]PZO84439.1 MAG: glutathione peroxidase [Paracoccus denitrificans]